LLGLFFNAEEGNFSPKRRWHSRITWHDTPEDITLFKPDHMRRHVSPRKVDINPPLLRSNTWFRSHILPGFIFFLFSLEYRSWESWEASVRFPAGVRFFSIPQRRDWLWGPRSLLFNGYPGLFLWCEVAGAWSR
jgi:hypothetical protein